MKPSDLLKERWESVPEIHKATRMPLDEICELLEKWVGQGLVLAGFIEHDCCRLPVFKLPSSWDQHNLRKLKVVKKTPTKSQEVAK